jgi:hypothetical protein
MKNLKKILIPAITLLLISTSVQSSESTADIIARAESAAPSQISKNATIYGIDGQTVLRKGTNGWYCTPGVYILPDDKHPMCNDGVWQKAMQAMANGSDFSTDRIGISYMLKGDAHVSNSNPAATDPNNGDVWVQEGPHLMIVVPKEQLIGVSRDPYNGGPYVMWENTPYAHIMAPIVNK